MYVQRSDNRQNNQNEVDTDRLNADITSGKLSMIFPTVPYPCLSYPCIQNGQKPGLLNLSLPVLTLTCNLTIHLEFGVFLFSSESEQPGKAVLRPQVNPKFAKVENICLCHGQCVTFLTYLIKPFLLQSGLDRFAHI